MLRCRFLVATLVALGCMVHVSAAWATDMSGTIASNTTWTTGGSPYMITGNVNVSSRRDVDDPGGRDGAGQRGIADVDDQRCVVGGGDVGVADRVHVWTTDSAPGQWAGITFTSTAAASSLAFVNMRYGGGSGPYRWERDVVDQWRRDAHGRGFAVQQ